MDYIRNELSNNDNYIDNRNELHYESLSFSTSTSGNIKNYISKSNSFEISSITYQKEEEHEEIIFNYSHNIPKKHILFNEKTLDSKFIEEIFQKKKEEKNNLQQKGNKQEKENNCRRNEEDMIRRKTAGHAINKGIIPKINKRLKEKADINVSDILFKKLPKNCIYEISKKCNKNVALMTLYQLFINKELYKEDNKQNYYYNLEVLEKLQSDNYKTIREEIDLETILNMTFYDLFQEYIYSDEFVEIVYSMICDKKI